MRLSGARVYRRLFQAAVLVSVLAGPAWAYQVDCRGNQCGGDGTRVFFYSVTGMAAPITEFIVGTNDLNPADYTEILMPPGWSFEITNNHMDHSHNNQTPRGQVSPGPICYCVTAGGVRWWTDNPTWSVTSADFGFNHPWSYEDVAWQLTAGQTYETDWSSPVGILGGVHGPAIPEPTTVSLLILGGAGLLRRITSRKYE